MQRDADVVVEGDAVRGIEDRCRRAGRRGSRRVTVGWRARGSQPVEAQPADDHDEPAADVVDLVDVGADQPGERLLDRVLGLAEVAEHPKGDVEQMAPVVAPGPADSTFRSRELLAVGGVFMRTVLLARWERAVVAGSSKRTLPAPECDIAMRVTSATSHRRPAASSF